MRGKINAVSTRDIMSWHFFFFFTTWYNGGLERFTAKVTFSNGGMDGQMIVKKGSEMEKGVQREGVKFQGVAPVKRGALKQHNDVITKKE